MVGGHGAGRRYAAASRERHHEDANTSMEEGKEGRSSPRGCGGRFAGDAVGTGASTDGGERAQRSDGEEAFPKPWPTIDDEISVRSHRRTRRRGSGARMRGQLTGDGELGGGGNPMAAITPSQVPEHTSMSARGRTRSEDGGEEVETLTGRQ